VQLQTQCSVLLTSQDAVTVSGCRGTGYVMTPYAVAGASFRDKTGAALLWGEKSKHSALADDILGRDQGIDERRPVPRLR
jgi:hypothetical protein